LHAQIKAWYGAPEDIFEEKVNGYLIDIVKGDLLVEIQTSHFQSIRKKLLCLLQEHKVKLVYPIPVNKWVVRYRSSVEGPFSHRRSPRHGIAEHLFEELIYISMLPLNPNFSIELLFIEQEDLWVDDGKGSWRRKYWSILDRRLVNVFGTQLFAQPVDYLSLLPKNLPTKFTSQDIAWQSNFSRKLANNMLYCLLKMDLLTHEGSRGRSRLYTINC